MASSTVASSRSAIEMDLNPRRPELPGSGLTFHFEDVRPIAAAVAVGAADEDVAQELHLDLLETRRRGSARTGPGRS